MVVLEILVIESADPYFDFAVSRVCGNHGRMQDLQVMLDGVDGRIFGVVFAFSGRVDQYGFLGVHDLPDFLFVESLVFEAFVNRAVGDCVLQDFRFPFPRCFAFQMRVIGLLEFLHVFFDGLFRILLHLGI